MIGLSFNQLFQNTLHYQHHMRKIVTARSAIDDSKPKSKIKCTKQPLSQFHRIYQMELQNKNLYFKITKPQSSIQNRSPNRKIIKNNRKLYYQQHERNLQNNGLLRRVNSAKTSYNIKELLAQRKQNEQYIQTISKFGFKHKKNNPFQFKIKMITENSHSLMQTYRSSRASKAQLRNSHEKLTKFSGQEEFKVFQDESNQVKSIERIKQRSPPRNEKRNRTQKS